MNLATSLYRILPVALLATCLPLNTSASNVEPEQYYYESREDIPEDYRWNLGLYFEDEKSWEAAFAKVESLLSRASEFEGKVADSPRDMARTLQYQFELHRLFQPLYVNANQKVHQDRNDSQATELAGRVEGLSAKVQEAVSFVQPEIARMSQEQETKFRASKELAPYLHYLDNIWRQREHSRSPEVEAVIAGSSLPGNGHVSAWESLNNADIKWPTIKDENGEDAVVSPGQFGRFLRSRDRDVRQRAFEAHLGTIENYQHTMAATMGASIQRDVWLARVYNYPSAVDAALSATNVPAEVMETLIDTVHDNVDKIQGYADLRRRILGYEELHPWDRHVSLLEGGGRKYTFDEAWGLAMQFWQETYGDEYAAIAQKTLDDRWIDVYSNEGKRSGAYSWGTYQRPVYLLLNWKGNFDDVSTLIHEMGHSIHGVLADQNQDFHNADSDIFVAEVGSVASESLFNEWMLERTKDPQERKQMIDAALTNVRNTFVTQIFFHEWEAKAHAMAEAGEALTAESMGQAYVDLHTLYNGDSMVPNDLTHVYWARISHFFRNFYVWKYATSFAAGEALAARFRSGDKSAAEDYLNMLRLGGSVYPLDVLKAGGVDMTDPEVIRAVMDRFEDLQAQLEKEFGL